MLMSQHWDHSIGCPGTQWRVFQKEQRITCSIMSPTFRTDRSWGNGSKLLTYMLHFKSQSSWRVGSLAPSPIAILGEFSPGHPRGTPVAGIGVCTGRAGAACLFSTFSNSLRTKPKPFPVGPGPAAVRSTTRSERAIPSGCCAPWTQYASPRNRLPQSAARLGFQNCSWAIVMS